MKLSLSHDRKVSPLGNYDPNYKRWIPGIANSFGLPSGESCPGRTEWCRDICYGRYSENNVGVRPALNRNLAVLQEAGSAEAMAALLIEAVGVFARSARRRLPKRDWIFRIHWDGDFFSLAYAEAWAATIRHYPDITFWAYTRSFAGDVNVVPILAGIENLHLYLSADTHNIAAAVEVAGTHPSVHLALCADDHEQAAALSTRPSTICPENAGRMALMNNGRGACVDCGLCVAGRADVRFATIQRGRPRADGRRLLKVIVPAPAERSCRYRRCGRVLPAHDGKGRPPEFCGNSCRWAESRLRRAESVA